MEERVGEFHMICGGQNEEVQRVEKVIATPHPPKNREIIRVIDLGFMYQLRSSLILRFFAEITSLVPFHIYYILLVTDQYPKEITNLASQKKSNPDVSVPGSTEVCAGQWAGHFSPCHLGGTQSQDWGHPHIADPYEHPGVWTSLQHIIPPPTQYIKAIKFGWLH